MNQSFLSTTTKPPVTAADPRGLKYSTCTCLVGSSVLAASNALSNPAGPLRSGRG